MRFNYGKQTKSLTQLGTSIRLAIEEYKKLDEMAIEDTGQHIVIERDLDTRFGLARFYNKIKQDEVDRPMPVIISIIPPRFISEQEQSYDMYDAVIQILFLDKKKYEEENKENPYKDRLDKYIIEIFEALQTSRHLCENRCLGYKVEHSPEGESSFLSAEIALLLTGKERTL